MRFRIAVATLALARGVIAADAPPAIGSIAPATLVQQLDRNANGCLDLEEGRNYTSRRFHALDASGDAVLDANEAPPLPGESSTARPIGIEAWQDAYTARFARFDADANGCLSVEEITQGRAAAAAGGAR
jgi:hypothetical protein